MELIPCESVYLNALGLPSYPWIIADPENTRYILNTHTPCIIKHKNKEIGFLFQKHCKNTLDIAYLAFHPEVMLSDIAEFCNSCIHGPVSITTYNMPLQPNLWEQFGFQIRPGHLWMESKADASGLAHNSLSVIEHISWPNSVSRIESIYHASFPEKEWSHLDAFKSDPEADIATVLIAKIGAVDVGFYVATPIESNTCFICWIGVTPEFRGKGVSHELFLEATHIANKNKQKKMALLVQPDNTAAIRFYQKQKMQTKWQRAYLTRE